MAPIEAVAGHYSSGTLWDRLVAALADDGIDPSGPSVTDLAPFDQFHGRGLEGTREMADGMAATPDDHLLDVGSGLGGPARYLADRFGCHVTGIDLTAEFCDVAERLNVATDLQGRVDIHRGSALDMPFDDDTFDGAVSMNVSMNIADRVALYREIRRVLRPGGWLMLSELAQGPNTGPLEFPMPWAGTAAESFLTTPDRTTELLEANGFRVDVCTDKSDENLDYRRRTRALIDQGQPSPARAVGLVHPESAAAAATNIGAGMAAGQLVPIEIRCVRVD